MIFVAQIAGSGSQVSGLGTVRPLSVQDPGIGGPDQDSGLSPKGHAAGLNRQSARNTRSWGRSLSHDSGHHVPFVVQPGRGRRKSDSGEISWVKTP